MKKNNLNSTKILKENLLEENTFASKEKFNFAQKKNNTIKSLTEVENFLHDFKKIGKYIKLYKILK